MGMTQTQKILAAHAGLAEVKAGQLINAKLDIVLGNDITTPVAINEFEKAGFNGVFDKEHIAIVLDHFVPNKDIKSATQSKQCREFANKYDILNFYDVGQMGIEHALLPEKGIVTAGDCVIGADSHTCTYGALGAFSTGVGSTDMAAGMAKGMAWFKVPAAIKVELKGQLHKPVTGTVSCSRCGVCKNALPPFRPDCCGGPAFCNSKADGRGTSRSCTDTDRDHRYRHSFCRPEISDDGQR